MTESEDGLLSAYQQPRLGPTSGHIISLSAKSHQIVLIDATMDNRDRLLNMLGACADGIHVEVRASVAECGTPPPDLVLLNISSTPVDDESVRRDLNEIRSRFGETPVVVITDLDSHEFVVAAFRHSVRGYVPTSLAREVVAAAIDLVLAGGTFIPEQLIAQYREAGAIRAGAADRAAEDPRLTTRETDVLRRLREGKPNKIIAYELRISESTVKVHVRSMMKKLRATNRTQVACLTHSAELRQAAEPIRGGVLASVRSG
jgi:DNA-binding NarL/FixJ family response regulator